MIQDYDGSDVFDAEGNKIGTVERTFVDDRGAGQFIEVKLGSLLAKHRVVPLDGADVGNQGIQVPFSKQEIEDSPDTKHVEDALEGDLLQHVRGYYSGGSSSGAMETDDTDDEGDVVASRPIDEAADDDENGDHGGIVERAKERLTGRGDEETPNGPETRGEILSSNQLGDLGAIRDRGDYIEIPIVEEELVKRPVVREVLRVRKSELTERRSVGADVRREDVETTPTGRVEEVRDEE